VADAKAKELFTLTAGAEALAVLEAGGALPVTGSQGGCYTLHKKASFCVTRLKDKAQMCAVVPGVPLYDHLLGIKLVIENDEKRFLATANVSGGGDNAGMFGPLFTEAMMRRVDRDIMRALDFESPSS